MKAPAQLGRACLAAAVGLVALWACTPAPAPAPPVPAELTGRAAVRADQTHLFDPQSRPRLWWPADAPPLRLRCRLADRAVEPPQVLDTQRLTVTDLAPCEGLTALEAVGGQGQIRARWPAALRAEVPAPAPAVSQARSHMKAGDLAAAEAAWVAAAEGAKAQGLPSLAARWRLSAAWCAEQGHRLPAMAEHAQAAKALRAGLADPQGRAALRYTQANLARRLGDFRSARRHYAAVAAAFRRFQLAGAAAMVQEAHALMLVDVGDLAGAAALLDAAAADVPPSDARAAARLALNRGWAGLLQAEAGGGRLADAERWLRVAAASPALEGPAKANAHVNLARAALARGDGAEAERHLVEAARLDPDQHGPWAAEARLLTAQVALQRKDWPAARARCEAEAARPDGPVHHRWRALACLAQAADGAGDLPAAIAVQGQALDELTRRARGTSLRAGRGPFLQARRALVQQAVGRLLRAGRPEAAFAVADAGRARLLRASQAPVRLATLDDTQRGAWAQRMATAEQAAARLQAHGAKAALVPEDRRAAWRAAQARLRGARDAAFEAAYRALDEAAQGHAAPGASVGRLAETLRADEALIAFSHVPAGWRAFVVGRGGLSVHALPTPAALGAVWAQVAEARHLYVVPGGYPHGFKAFTTGQAPAALRWTVSWLPYAGLAADRAAPRAGATLVVGDPNHDLRGAYVEAGWVAGQRAGSVSLMRGQATVSRVRSQLKGAAHIHFAGHGVLAERDPWAAHLQLADGLLDVTDLLTVGLEGAPVVVLSGCETGVDSVLLDDSAVGLSEAFLALGARSVVATDRPVADGSALRFMKAFYGAGGADRPAHGVQAAAKALRAAGDPHWAAFRVIGLR